MIYAPNSEILLENKANFNGGLVGKTVELKNDVRFTFDPNSLTPTGSTALVYQPMAATRVLAPAVGRAARQRVLSTSTRPSAPAPAD